MDTSPLDAFHYLYKNARRTIESSRAYQERQAYLAEKQKLDKQYAYELKQRKAIKERRITLEMASSVSILMKLSDAKPDYWMHDVPAYETRGWLGFKREVQVGTRKQITLEGWELELNPDSDARSRFEFMQASHTLILTPDENIPGHPPLVWRTGFRNEFTKEDIKPLSHVPLSADDMPWNRPLENKRQAPLHKLRPNSIADYIERHYEQLEPDRVIRAEPDEDEITRIKERREAIGNPDPRLIFASIKLERARNNADYDTYKKAGIERKIQKAIAQVAAQHNILNLR